MSAVDYFMQAPPVSRTLAAATLTLSILVYSKILPGSYVVFYIPYLMKLPPQLWRVFTSFLITGPDLGILFDTYFLYTYGSKLETASPRFAQPGDFFTYLVFVAVTILVSTIFIAAFPSCIPHIICPRSAIFPTIAVPGDEEDYPHTSAGPSFAINPKGPVRGVGMGLNVVFTGGVVFTSALVLALAYTSTQDERGQKASFFIVTIPAQWIPYAMLLMTLVMAGPPAAKIQATGLIAAHMHDFLTRIWPTFGGGRNLVPTPAFVKRMFQTTQASVQSTSYGTAFAPAQRAATSSGSSAGVLPESWRTRGTGHRLGGD
ncbi:derlin-1 [Coleophoma cylindrospora]|uniref:Derlin n=1 Tax=Coleophoma cylindrospora TaxID=1849047 RepID=A0A3D8STG9_9HELO|nr:derlin-1 [Coleophoma cylindrospora]